MHQATAAAHRPSSNFKIKLDICSVLALYKCRYTGYTTLLCNYRYEKTEWSSNEMLLGIFRLKWYAAFGIKQSSSVGKSIHKLRDFALHMSSVRYGSISIGQGKQENLSREGKLRCNIGGGTWASKAGGGDGRTLPRSLKISGGRPSRNDDISVSFFSVLGISLYRGKSGSISNKLPPRLSKLSLWMPQNKAHYSCS